MLEVKSWKSLWMKNRAGWVGVLLSVLSCSRLDGQIESALVPRDAARHSRWQPVSQIFENKSERRSWVGFLFFCVSASLSVPLTAVTKANWEWPQRFRHSSRGQGGGRGCWQKQVLAKEQLLFFFFFSVWRMSCAAKARQAILYGKQIKFLFHRRSLSLPAGLVPSNGNITILEDQTVRTIGSLRMMIDRRLFISCPIACYLSLVVMLQLVLPRNLQVRAKAWLISGEIIQLIYISNCKNNCGLCALVPR